uniref:Uncharacterized protein n=1 Tax=Anopheles melas TaxID=34690 RepID=A0A182TGY9_9DIPT
MSHRVDSSYRLGSRGDKTPTRFPLSSPHKSTMRSSSTVLCVCLGVALIQLFGVVIAGPVPDPVLHVSLETVPDLEAFRRANQDLQVTPLVPVRQSEVFAGGSTRQQIVYSVGAHSASERLVGLSSNQQSWPTPQDSWPTPQDVRLDLQYPTAGVGAVVSYVEVVVQQSTNLGRGYVVSDGSSVPRTLVVVQQSTNLGRGYVVSGGVGQRQIRLVIEAYSTLYFSYTAAIYGF